MKNKTMEELLSELNREDREKFEYLLNFYTVEHVYYNFEHYKHALSGFKPFLYEKFEEPVPEKIKMLVSKIELRDVLLGLESFKTNYSTANKKSVDDLLIYLTMHSSQKDTTLKKMVNSNPKYKRMVEKGYVTEDEILFIIKSTYDEELIRDISLEHPLDLMKIDDRITEKVISVVRPRIDNASLFEVRFDLNERPPEQCIFVLSPEVADKLSQKDIKEAYERDSNVITSNTDILVIKACLGDKFKKTDLSVIEKLKAVLRNYELRKITDKDLEFLSENVHGNSEEVFYLKNIASDPDALRAYSELPEHLKEQMLKFNVVVSAEDARNVLNALDSISIKLDEEIKKGRESKLEEEPLPDVVRNLRNLPQDRIPEIINVFRADNISKVSKLKESVGLDSRITMGIEIEVAGFSPEALKELVKHKELFKEIKVRRNIDTNLNGWKIEEEGSVDNGNGLELITPVLKDKKEDWKSLEQSCKLLQVLNAGPDSSTGLHVHIGADILGTDEEAWKNLFKIWRNAEELIYLISNPHGETARPGILEQAGPTASIIDEMFNKNLIKINSREDLKKVASEYSRRSLRYVTFSGRPKSMNLQCIAEGKQDTIEFRIPNGITDPVEIQRTAMMFGKIVETAKKLSEDKDYKKDVFESFKSEGNQDKKLLSFLDLIFDDIESKVVFLDRFYAQKEKRAKLAGRDYYDILDEEIRRDENEIPEWRGHR